MNILSFETAVRLKEAGFPQPKMAYWNCFFYDKSGVLWRPGSLTFNPDIFAQTATDILEQLPGYVIGRGQTHWFCCNEFDKETAFVSDNPHEAAAASWLKLNKKQDEQI